MAERTYVIVLEVEVEGYYFDYESSDTSLAADDLGHIGNDLRGLGDHQRKYKVRSIQAT